MAEMGFEDFYKVPDLKFDISRLRKDLEKVLERKNLNLLELLTLEQSHLIEYLTIKVQLKGIMYEENTGLLLTRVEKKCLEI